MDQQSVEPEEEVRSDTSPDDGEAVEVEIVQSEDDEAGDTGDVAELKSAELEKALEAARVEAEDHKDKWLRAQAELQNTRRRANREMDEMRLRAGERILKQLLEPADNLARAIEAGRSDAATEEAGYEAMLRGIEITYAQLMEVLQREQVLLMETTGEPFDPMKHEAMMAVEHPDVPDGVILEEISRGYTLGDRVLRHARVIVSKGPAPSEENSGDDGPADPDSDNHKHTEDE